MSSHSPEERDWLAAERALGLLDGEALAEARRLEAVDPEFAKEVARWSLRFSPLLDSIAPVEPPATAFQHIERRLLSNDNVVSLRQRLRRWQVATGGLAALAASLALVMVVQPGSEAPSPEPQSHAAPMVAMLEGGPNRLVATWNGDESLMIVPAVVAASDARHSHELWMITKGGKPRSKGVMPAGPMHLEVAPATAEMLAEGATFAVSLEPAGGSPSGLPTGPVIASGKLERA